MANLRDLIRFERLPSSILPSWVDRLLSAGIVATDPKVVRRHKIVNIASYAAAFNSVSRVVASTFYAFDGAYIVQTVSACFAIAAVMIPRLHRFGDNASAIALFLWFVLSVTFAAAVSGLSSQVQVYFVLAGVTWLLFGLEHWKLCVAGIAVNCAVMLLVLRFAPQYGIAVSEAPGAAEYFSVQSMLNAIAINAVVILYALLLLQRTERDLERQTARAEGLLSVVLPATVADRLRAEPDQSIADRIDGATILFADLEGFTSAAHAEEPEIVVAYLDRLVRSFDDACNEYGVEKIKSVGDAYMAAGGLNGDRMGGAVAVGRLALGMLRLHDGLPALGRHRLRLRIGIHTGPAIAGVIGGTRISYDLWGDAVNVASRMESQGVPGRIHVSEAFRLAAEDTFEFEPRGDSDLRGIGTVPTFFLLKERAGR